MSFGHLILTSNQSSSAACATASPMTSVNVKKIANALLPIIVPPYFWLCSARFLSVHDYIINPSNYNEIHCIGGKKYLYCCNRRAQRAPHGSSQKGYRLRKRANPAAVRNICLPMVRILASDMPSSSMLTKKSASTRI